MKRVALLVAIALAGCLPYKAYRVEPPPRSQGLYSSVIGDWGSNFGDIVIEPDESRGGLAMGSVRGTWTYFNEKVSRQVTGTFQGTLRGNVLRLTWSEGFATGHGFLQFAQTGDTYEGQWWNSQHTKTGVWRGWRPGMQGGV